MDRDKKKPDSRQRLAEPHVRAAYLAMPTPRSLRRLHADLARGDGDAPSLGTVERWSRRHGWSRLAREHDVRVATRAATIVEKAQAKTAAERASWLLEQGEKLVELGVLLAHEGDPAALVRVGIEVQKYADVLTGGVSDRTEAVTAPRTDMSPEAIRQREIDRLMSLTSKVRGVNATVNLACVLDSQDKSIFELEEPANGTAKDGTTSSPS